MSFRIFVLVAVFIFYQNDLSAQSPFSKQKNLLEIEINKIAKNKDLTISYCLLDPSGKEIYSYNKSKNLTPASTLKIYTTGAALALLGEDFKYSTCLEYDGHVDSCGVLRGNLYLTGSGDPTLGSDRFPGRLGYAEILNLFGDAVKEIGITRIEGNIVADNSYFSECLTPDTWPLDDVANYYGAAPNGLCLNENSYKLFFQPGSAVGQKTKILGTDPVTIPGLSFENHVTTYLPGSGDQAVIMEDHFKAEKPVVGTIPSGVKSFFIRGSIPDPANLTSYLLAEDLKKKGIDVSGKSYSIYNNSFNPTQSHRYRFYTHLSPPLIEIISQVNQRSHNLFAETLTVTLGKIYRDEGNYEKGMEVVLEYWASRGIDLKNSELFDGSGLSPLNKISTKVLAGMLFNIKQDSSFANFRITLPVVGVSGTLKNFCKNTPAKGKVFAKSGSIEKVRSYAGYAQTKSGSYLPFALIANDFENNFKSIIPSLEKIMVLMTEIP